MKVFGSAATVILQLLLVVVCIEITQAGKGNKWLRQGKGKRGRQKGKKVSAKMKERVRSGGPQEFKALPNDVDLSFSLPNRTAVLRLHRSSGIASDFDIIVPERGKPMKRRKNKRGDFAVYYDVVTQASVISVPETRAARGRKYMGTFKMGKKEFLIEPEDFALKPSEFIDPDGGINEQGPEKEDTYGIYAMDEDPEEQLPTGQPRMDEERFRMINDFQPLSLRAEQGQAKSSDGYVSQTWVFVDASEYNYWYLLSDETTHKDKQEDAIQNIRFYYSHLMNGINLRYTSRFDSIKLSTVLAGLYIPSSAAESPWTETNKFEDGGITYTDAYKSLDYLEKWAYIQYEALQPMDQALLYTRLKLTNRGTDGSYYRISGLGNIAGACLIDKSRQLFKGVSINFASGLYQSTTTGAHEMGHVLGSHHDGSQNTCSFSDQFVMASSPYQLEDSNLLNPFTFSPCSVDYFQKYMNYLNLNKQNCMTNDSTSRENFMDAALLTPPGQKFDVNQQCKIIHGKQSYYCGGQKNDENMCRYMECYDPNVDKCVTNIEQRAINGTTCGNNKWCLKAHCVADSEAPDAVDFCRNGDYTGTLTGGITCAAIREGRVALAECNKLVTFNQCCKTCTDLVNYDNPSCPFGDSNPAYCKDIKRYDCYGSTALGICCDTCAKYRQPITGCAYGDRAEWCKNTTRGSCYANEKTCCETCQPLAGPDPDCKYGDAAGWCDGITSSRCYNDNKQCCETCKKFETNIQGCQYGDYGDHCTQDRCAADPKFCCGTCHQTSTTTTAATTTTGSTTEGCTGPDLFEWCNDPNVLFICYEQPTMCCTTCNSRKLINAPDCLYGDRTTECGDADEALCQLPRFKEQCCASCSRFLTTTTQAPPTMTTLHPMMECSGANLFDWCETSQNADCSSCYGGFQQDCCETCNNCISGTTKACLFGDKFIDYCARQEPLACYYEPLRKDCCSFCEKANRGVVGCEYGDRLPDCPADRCDEPAIKEICCATCAKTVTIPTRADCKNKAGWCTTMPPRDCYVSEDTCCDRCSKEYTGVLGCEYKDVVGWCADAIESRDDCFRPDIAIHCCSNCSERFGIVTATRTTTDLRGARGASQRLDPGDGTMIVIENLEIKQLVKKSRVFLRSITNIINNFCSDYAEICCREFNMEPRTKPARKRFWIKMRDSVIWNITTLDENQQKGVLLQVKVKLRQNIKNRFCKEAPNTPQSLTEHFTTKTLQEIVSHYAKDMEEKLKEKIIRVGDKILVQGEEEEEKSKSKKAKKKNKKEKKKERKAKRKSKQEERKSKQEERKSKREERKSKTEERKSKREERKSKQEERKSKREERKSKREERKSKREEKRRGRNP